MWDWSWLHTAAVVVVLGLIAAGVLIGIIFVCVRGTITLLSAGPTLARLAWAKLTGRPPTSHGSAHVATAAEIERHGLFNAQGLPLGTYQGQTLREAMGAPLPCLQPVLTHTATRLQRTLQRLQDTLQRYQGLPVP